MTPGCENGAQAGDGEAGFALLETVIAFVILATALAVAMQTVSQSARALVRAADLERAGQVLDSLAVSRLRSLERAGTFGGEDDRGGEWQVTARDVRDARSRPLFSVEATVWPRGRSGPQFSYHTFAVGGDGP